MNGSPEENDGDDYDPGRVPRQYQLEILELAKKENTIACLPTGTGKTYIAVMLIKHFAHQLAADYSTKDGKRTVFLVPQKTLVAQQATEIKSFTGLEVGEYTGDLDVDSWLKPRWLKEFHEFKVLVMTHQIFLNLLLSYFMPLSKVNLLVFDEAHHASQKKKAKDKSNSVYRQIMAYMDQRDKKEWPHIFGLTASIISNKAKAHEIVDLIRLLEKTYSAKCQTVANDMLGEHKTKARQVIWVANDEEVGTVCPALLHMLNWSVGFTEKLDSYFKDMNRINLPIDCGDLKKTLTNIKQITQDMGIWCGKYACELFAEEMKQNARLFEDSYPMFYTFLDLMCNFLDYCSKSADRVLGGKSLKSKLLDFASPKMRRLLQLLENYSPFHQKANPKAMSAIVFVKKRIDSKVLSHWLEEVAACDRKNFGFLAVGYVVGYSMRPGFVSKVSSSSLLQQQEMLKSFKDGKRNLLVATSVLEEGLDVPQCNLIVRYDEPKTFREWQQSMGRARADDAFYVLLCQKAGEALLYQNVIEFKETETVLKSYCQLRVEIREGAGFQETEDSSKEQCIVSATGAKITPETCISLVHRYCQQLPSDAFAACSPVDILEDPQEGEETTNFKYTIHLPLNSAIKEPVTGPWRTNRKSAKKAVYMQICQMLVDTGSALDENLIPIRKEVALVNLMKELGLVEEQETEVVCDVKDVEVKEKVAPKAGTRRMKRWYERAIHVSFSGKFGSTETQWVLYRVNLGRRGAPLQDNNYDVHDIDLGILSSSKLALDSIGSGFLLFSKLSEFNVVLEMIDSNLTLNQDQLSAAKFFNRFTFEQSLEFDQRNLEFDPEKASISCLVVPLSRRRDIHWDFVESVRVKAKMNEDLKRECLDRKVRTNFVYRREEYEDALLVPWYRMKKEHEQDESEDEVTVKCKREVVFLAHRVDEGFNPRSPFPENKNDKNKTLYRDYEEYFNKKYNIQLSDLNQHLVQVEYMEKLARVSRLKRKRKVKRIHLVPELCYIHPFPASFWRKALCIPAVIYRINSWLNAASFRELIAREAGVGMVAKMDSSLEWLSLTAKIDEDRLNWNHFELQSEDVEMEQEGGDVWVEQVAAEINSDPEDNRPEAADYYCDSESEDVEDEEDMEVFYSSDSSEDDEEEEVAMDAMVDFGYGSQVFSETEDKHNGSVKQDENDTEADQRSGDENVVEFRRPTENNLFGSTPRASSISSVNYFSDHQINLGVFTAEDQLYINETISKGLIKALNDVCSNTFVVPEPVEETDSVFVPLQESASTRVHSFDDKRTIVQGPDPVNLLEAFTAKSSGDCFDLERNETIGDSFLKLTTTDFLYQICSQLHEGLLSPLKGRLVSNLTLYNLAKKKNIAQYMVSSPFEPHTNWTPPGYVVGPSFEMASRPGPHKDGNPRTHQYIGDKSVADCVEALIGAVLLSSGPMAAVKFMKWMGLKVTTYEDLGDNLDHWLPPPESPISKNIIEGKVDWAKEEVTRLYHNSNLAQVERLLGYTFNDRGFLVQAFTHNSYYDNTVTGCYQRLEFVGDAVLDYLVTRFLFADPESHFSPGQMTDIRSALVNNCFFGCLVVKNSLHQHLSCYQPDLTRTIRNFAESFKDGAKEYLTGLTIGSFIVIDGNDEEGDNNEAIEVPKVLGDIFEAIAGAVYMDSNRSLDAVWKVFYRLMKNELEHFSKNIPRNPIALVYETDPSSKFINGEVTEKDSYKIDLQFRGKIFEGKGRNKKFAKVSAAKRAMKDVTSKP